MCVNNHVFLGCVSDLFHRLFCSVQKEREMDYQMEEEESIFSALAGGGGGAFVVDEDGNAEVFAELDGRHTLVDFHDAFVQSKAEKRKKGMPAARKVLFCFFFCFCGLDDLFLFFEYIKNVFLSSLIFFYS